MTFKAKTIIALIIAGLLVVLGWAVSHYHEKYQAEKNRADAADQSASTAEAITANVIQAVNVMNAITEASQDAKKQIAVESQRTQTDIKVAVAADDCARQPVPVAAADRLREYANSLREGSGGTAASKPDR